jgi:branched-chain amino acid transport system substrate-binding protein
LSIRQSRGLPVPLHASQATAFVLAAVCFLAPAVAGCGGGEGTAAGASVDVYVSAPLSGAQAKQGRAMCAGARHELVRHGSQGGMVEIRVRCLDDTGGGAHWTLAAIGANARRATEDSSSIGYIGELDPAATKFSRPILEAAGIPQLANQSGSAAMTKLLSAIDGAGDSSSLREAVLGELPES